MKDFTKLPIPHKVHMLAHKMESIQGVLLQEQFNLTFSNYVLLFILQSKGEQSQNKLCPYMNMTPAGVSKQITKLSDMDLIAVVTNPHNRRENIISLTEKGKETQEYATQEIIKQFQEQTKDISSINSFEQQLNIMIQRFMTETDEC